MAASALSGSTFQTFITYVNTDLILPVDKVGERSYRLVTLGIKVNEEESVHLLDTSTPKEARLEVMANLLDGSYMLDHHQSELSSTKAFAESIQDILSQA